MTDWLDAPWLWSARWLFVRGLAIVCALAFLNARNQFPALLGERGLMPAPAFLERTSWRTAPSLFHLGYSDRRLTVIAWVGIALSVATVVGLPQQGPAWVSLLTWLAIYGLYLSIVNVGQRFYSFGWESLILEAAFLAAFLGPDDTAPPVVMLAALWWLLFRIEWGAGLIKIRGDRCWRDLTCLYYHHETQPMPNGLSRWFHHLPKSAHKVEVAANHVVQLGMPLLLVAPQPVRGLAAGTMVVTQAWLILSGNFAWLNAVTLLLALTAVWPGLLDLLTPGPPAELASLPLWHDVLVLAVGLGVVVLAWWPLRNMLSPAQAMNASFNPFHLGNTYGAFGSITRRRAEVVIEGTTDPHPHPDSDWREYQFKGKPGDPSRRPPFVAPYHLRLDWLMWFLALSPGYGRGWFTPFLNRLLTADAATLALLRQDPFDGQRPTAVRAQIYAYRFTTAEERRRTGDWWVRRLQGDLTGICVAPPE